MKQRFDRENAVIKENRPESVPLLVEGTYIFKRKCAREQVLITPVLSTIQDTQVKKQSGTAQLTPLMEIKGAFFVSYKRTVQKERTLCMKKQLKKDVFDILADVVTSEPVKMMKKAYEETKTAKCLKNIKSN